MSKIRVLDFDEYPGLRHCSVSEFSGEEYYHKILNDDFKKAYENKEVLIVELDGTDAYASSFLDEAFGNLVYDFTLANVSRLIKIISNDEPHWVKMLQEKTFKEWETRRKNNEKPIVTELHEPWFRLVDSKIKKEVWEMP
jgi:hypothetical protein